MLKKILTTILILTLLASCSSSKKSSLKVEKEAKNLNYSNKNSVPSNCDKTYIYGKLKEKNTNTSYQKKFIDPTPGSDLYTAYNAGGLSCSYQIGSQEINIIWSPFYETLFAPLLLNWIESGMSETNLPDLAAKNYILFSGKNTNPTQMVRKAISHTQEHWISIELNKPADLSTIKEYLTLAYASFITKEEASLNSLLNTCYINNIKPATSSQIKSININYHENTTFTAELLLNTNYPVSKTLLIGNYENNILHGIFTSKSEGEIIEQELYLYGNSSGFKESSTPLNTKNNLNQLLYPRPLDLKFNSINSFTPINCTQ
jgi:hypothetical protein